MEIYIIFYFQIFGLLLPDDDNFAESIQLILYKRICKSDQSVMIMIVPGKSMRLNKDIMIFRIPT